MLREAVIIDTGPLVALYNDRDPSHAACRGIMDIIPFGKAYTCWPVITEAAYLLRKYARQRDDLLRSIVDRDVLILRLRERDVEPVVDIFTKYQDQDIDFADACLVHLADRESIDTVLTLDRRHFSVLRRLNGDVLNILPEES
jgi:predicted nucleic acid-binding protein